MNELIVIIGPTATGKTKLAVKLASQFKGEIISVDSRQVYKGMDIGTGKDADEYKARQAASKTSEISNREKILKQIPYHLVNITTPDKQFSLVEFQQACYKKMEQIWKRGNVPFLVGGTGLYIEAILNQYQIPQVKPNLKLRQKLERESMSELLQNLRKINPKQYKKVDKKNKRRIIRAIEVALDKNQESGIRNRESGIMNYEFLIIGVEKDKQELDELINKRVDKMIRQGLVQETKKLVKKYGMGAVPLQTIGYKEIIDYLNKKTSMEEAVRLIKLHTKQFAKRQMTWLNGMEKRNKANMINWVQNYASAKNTVKSFISND